MPKLICDVRNCSNNKENYCTLTGIQVDGTGATNVEGTCCADFTGSEYAASNQTHQVQTAVDIECTAGGCIYNACKKCTASEVAMSGASTATCSHDTQCGSFWCK